MLSWPPYVIGHAIIFLPCDFYLSSCYFLLLFLSSPNLRGRRLDVYCTSTHGVALVRIRMHVWNVLHAAHWKYRTQKIAISAPSHNFFRLYLPNQGMYRQSEKSLLKSSTSFTCLLNMLNFGPLTAEICWRVWGTLQISTGFVSWQHYCTAL